MQLPGGAFCSMYADVIYDNTLVVMRRIEDPANDMEEILNVRMNTYRQVIEHLFGDLFQLFDLLNRKKKFRIYRKGKEMYAIVLVCFFIQNCYTCYYGNKCQTQHNAEKPDINMYLNVNEEFEIVEWDSDDEF